MMLLNSLVFWVSLAASAADLLSGALPGALSLLAGVLAQTPSGTPTPSPTATSTEDSTFTLRLAKDVMVRGLTLGVVAFTIGLMIGKPVINWLRDRRIGKSIRIEGPASHQIKTGTPTMGGIIFLIPLIIVIGIFMDIPKFLSLLLPLAIVVSCGILGGFDDLLSTVVRNRGGLAGRFKMAWLLVIAFIAAWVIYYPLKHQSVFVPFITNKDVEAIAVPAPVYLLLAVLAIVGTANTVNLTDGLDTLAGGTTAIAFVSVGIIAFLQGVEPVVLVCFATVGSLLAFLWFNSHPAQVFMGDAGSLTLGALLAVCALLTDQWLLLPLVGIVFVAEGISDILQVLYFKLTKGKRLFRMAPIHHHFEQIGWSETQVTMRFWLVGMLAGMLGVALALV
ncbi:MAG: phospho-N-acetylmuramoyl-pentapeptide-transferase [Chloroflexia bacterium]|jgi:phospho-N-acetylmuramoyl-pentapeptide-transferase|nr:phospho-N-acetylmuramoyl-pentapeptide-transferase [Chloroflexia bacterium]